VPRERALSVAVLLEEWGQRLSELFLGFMHRIRERHLTCTRPNAGYVWRGVVWPGAGGHVMI
jgi:hypothetical protein